MMGKKNKGKIERFCTIYPLMMLLFFVATLVLGFTIDMPSFKVISICIFYFLLRFYVDIKHNNFEKNNAILKKVKEYRMKNDKERFTDIMKYHILTGSVIYRILVDISMIVTIIILLIPDDDVKPYSFVSGIIAFSILLLQYKEYAVKEKLKKKIKKMKINF